MQTLEGTIDLHIHAGPDVRERKLSYLEAALQADQAGMKAIVVKSHHTLTADIASLLQTQVKQVKIFGGIALNESLGGLNPEAVEAALKLGGKIIWMPTLSAENHRRYFGEKGGISVLDRADRLKKRVVDILRMISKAGIILATGHLSTKEILVLVREARRRKIERILVTHPEFPAIDMPVPVQQALARKGVFFDRCFPREDMCVLDMEGMAHRIRAVGADSTILTTDFGQPQSPFPVEGLRRYIDELSHEGFAQQEIDQMVKVSPAKLLGID